MDKELERLKSETYERLLKYNSPEIARNFAENIVKITGWYKGKPEKVLMTSGIEVYL